jgi:hypothetical protein
MVVAPASTPLALSLKPVLLGHASDSLNPKWLGNERLYYEDKAEDERDQPIRDQIVQLNRSARTIAKGREGSAQVRARSAEAATLKEKTAIRRLRIEFVVQAIA